MLFTVYCLLFTIIKTMISNLPLGHLIISSGTKNDFLSYLKTCLAAKKRTYCIPLNLTKYVVSKQDLKLKKVINSADITIADGIPIMWMSRRLGYKDVHHVTGINFAESILTQSKSQNWKIFLLGASPQNLDRVLQNVKERFKNPRIMGAYHGYFNKSYLKQVVKKINQLKPDILFLGLGMPQKEYFIYDYFDEIDAKFWLPVGGTFDVWAHAKKRAPQFVQKMGFEWFYRSFGNKTKAINIMKHSFVFSKDFLFNNKQ